MSALDPRTRAWVALAQEAQRWGAGAAEAQAYADAELEGTRGRVMVLAGELADLRGLLAAPLVRLLARLAGH